MICSPQNPPYRRVCHSTHQFTLVFTNSSYRSQSSNKRALVLVILHLHHKKLIQRAQRGSNRCWWESLPPVSKEGNRGTDYDQFAPGRACQEQRCEGQAALPTPHRTGRWCAAPPHALSPRGATGRGLQRAAPSPRRNPTARWHRQKNKFAR